MVRIVPQESLPGVFGKVQAGTTGGRAAALVGKAIKPTPRAAAEARSNVIRLVVHMGGLLLSYVLVEAFPRTARLFSPRYTSFTTGSSCRKRPLS
jgi:hypothetical protein